MSCVLCLCQPIDDELWFTAFSWHFAVEVLFWQSRQTSTGRTNQPHGRWMPQPPLAKKKKRKLVIFWWSISRSCSRVWWNIHRRKFVKYTFHAVKTSRSFEPVAPDAKQTSYSRLNVILSFSSTDNSVISFQNATQATWSWTATEDMRLICKETVHWYNVIRQKSVHLPEVWLPAESGQVTCLLSEYSGRIHPDLPTSDIDRAEK